MQGKILVVTSYPTGEDDLRGEYGTGKKGALLRKVLKDSGVLYDDATITSCVRCAPPTFFPNITHSIGPCRPYLQEDIAQLQPTIIISMGNAALVSLTKKSGIKKHRGKVYPLHKDFGMMYNTHPTYGIEDLVKVPTYYKVIVSDIRNATKGQTTPAKVQFTYWKVDYGSALQA